MTAPAPRPAPQKVVLAEKFALLRDHWSPRIAARYNGNEVRLARASGDFQWHCHEDSDELFIVLDGELHMEFRTHVEVIGPGELIVVPHGVEHFPRVPLGEVKMIVIDPADTANTGDPETAYAAQDI